MARGSRATDFGQLSAQLGEHWRVVRLVGGRISAGVAGGVDDGGGTASVGSSPIQSGTGTNTASVGCTQIIE